MTKKPKPARSLGPGEADLWRRVMEDVTPLPGRKPAPSAAPPADRDAPSAPSAPLIPAAPPAQAPRAAAPPPPLPVLEPGAGAGVDKRTAARLRKGRLPIEGRLDLHGLTQGQAHRELDHFLASAHEAGSRCVLVITGKGLKKDGSVGVLRSAVPGWLNRPPNRARVVAFTRAVPRDGGTGALYVLIKRKRGR